MRERRRDRGGGGMTVHTLHVSFWSCICDALTWEWESWLIFTKNHQNQNVIKQNFGWFSNDKFTWVFFLAVTQRPHADRFLDQSCSPKLNRTSSYRCISLQSDLSLEWTTKLVKLYRTNKNYVASHITATYVSPCSRSPQFEVCHHIVVTSFV